VNQFLDPTPRKPDKQHVSFDADCRRHLLRELQMGGKEKSAAQQTAYWTVLFAASSPSPSAHAQFEAQRQLRSLSGSPLRGVGAPERGKMLRRLCTCARNIAHHAVRGAGPSCCVRRDAPFSPYAARRTRREPWPAVSVLAHSLAPALAPSRVPPWVDSLKLPRWHRSEKIRAPTGSQRTLRQSTADSVKAPSISHAAARFV
jgi:hypothetical protein